MNDEENKVYAVEKLRSIARWVDYSKEDSNYVVKSVSDFEKLYDVMIASGWDMYLDDFCVLAFTAACDGKHDEAVKLQKAWMEHNEYHVAGRSECRHCIAAGRVDGYCPEHEEPHDPDGYCRSCGEGGY